MLTSFPDLEKQGGNLIVESILRGILFAAEERQCSSFNTIYVQLDNCNTNKCATVIVVCALLVKLGICRKVKVNFLEVGSYSRRYRRPHWISFYEASHCGS